MKLSDKVELKKGAWSPEEDEMLIAYIKRYGIWNWSRMPKAAGLSRSGKSCRLRWVNYLRPDLKRGRFSMEEIETIIKLHESLGNKWSQIAAQLPGRTDNEIKNFWHTHMRKGFKTTTTVPGADYYRPKKAKHEKKRVTDINTSLGYGAEESSIEVSNIIAESTEFPIAESYSPSQDCDVVTEGTENMGFISCGTHGEILEDVYLSEIDSAIFEELDHAYPAHELKVQESLYALNNDELTSFWVNVLMEATQQQKAVEAISECHGYRCYC